MHGNVSRGASVCLALFVGCLLAGDARAGVFRLRRMVVVGDSLLAGFGSGGFVGVGRRPSSPPG